VALPFEEVLASKDIGQARNYSVKETYKQEDLIRHPTFGLGVVTQTRPDKVDVTFKMYVKTLIHGRGETPGAKPAFAPPKAATEGPADKPSQRRNPLRPILENEKVTGMSHPHP